MAITINQQPYELKLAVERVQRYQDLKGEGAISSIKLPDWASFKRDSDSFKRAFA